MAMPIVPEERPPAMLDGKANPAYHRWYYQTHKEQARKQAKRWKAEHPEQVRASTLRTRAKSDYKARKRVARQKWLAANAEARREYMRGYRAKNREQCRIGSRATKAKHHARIRARARELYAQDPERFQEYVHAYRARRHHAPVSDLTADQWREIKAVYGHRCVYCGRKLRRLTMDHITPLSKGGSHTRSNVVPACSSCNSHKSAGEVLCPVQPLLLTIA